MACPTCGVITADGAECAGCRKSGDRRPGPPSSRLPGLVLSVGATIGASLLVLGLSYVADSLWPPTRTRKLDFAALGASLCVDLLFAGVPLCAWSLCAKTRWGLWGYAWRLAVCLAGVLWLLSLAPKGT